MRNKSSLVNFGNVAKQMGLAITPAQARRVEASVAIRSETPESEDISYQHAALAQVFFPRKKTVTDVYESRVGLVSVRISAGVAYSEGQFVPQPIPYGAKSRLVLINLISSAVKTGSPEVEVGHSMHDFMQRLGISGQGSEYRSLRMQMSALAAANVVIGFRDTDGRDKTVKGNLVSEFTMLASRDERQRTLWPQTVTLSREFFNSVKEHAVPLDLRAVQAIKGSALSLDLYSFLAHRLYRIDSPHGLILPWPLLQRQLGPEFKDLRDFRREMRRSLKQVLAVYPAARVDEPEGHDGVRFRQSPPPISRRLVSGV